MTQALATAAADRRPFSRYRLLETTDVDEAQRVGARLITDNRLLLPREHTLSAHINGVSLNSVALYYMNYGTQLDVDSAPLQGSFALLLPLQGTLRVRHRGQEFEATACQSAGVISPDLDLRMGWSPDLSMFCIRIDDRALSEFTGCLIRNSGRRTLAFDPAMARPAAVHSLLAVARLVQDVFDRPEAAAGLAPPLAARLREQLMTTLLMTHRSTFSDLLFQQPARVSQRAVRQAVDIIESDPAAVPTVTGLARRIGITARALQLGFQRELGRSPASYIREVRLARARADLLTSTPGDGTTVTDVALRWGFTHTSRFAHYYQEKYHETPSATLRTDAH
jgi:AraC-like DNA-binding protein